MASGRNAGWLTASFRCIVLSCLAVGAGQARSQAVTSAGELRDACTRPDQAWVSYCSGYAQAAIDFVGMADLACVPENTSRTDIVTQIDRLAFDNIADGEIDKDMPALTVAISVLQTLYPCDANGEASE